jgi:hypothetical protein
MEFTTSTGKRRAGNEPPRPEATVIPLRDPRAGRRRSRPLAGIQAPTAWYMPKMGEVKLFLTRGRRVDFFGEKQSPCDVRGPEGTRKNFRRFFTGFPSLPRYNRGSATMFSR